RDCAKRSLRGPDQHLRGRQPAPSKATHITTRRRQGNRMVEKSRRDAPPSQATADDMDFDLDRALRSVVALQSSVPEDAFTASDMGTERAGRGVLNRDSGLIATIG